jgi:NAD-dependent dihydropyrimidine dehydrogenase PreA subunit
VIALIGSGPSAFALATLLQELGVAFEVLDIGRMPSRSAEEAKKIWQETSKSKYSKLSKTLPNSSDKPDVGVGRKTYFGESYSYLESSAHWATSKGTNVTSSSGLGGFSRVWGATLLPFSEKDMDFWPKELREYQQEINEIYSLLPMGVSQIQNSFHYGKTPNSARVFPIDPRIFKLLSTSRFKSIFQANGSELLASRLALNTETCIACNSCISGCPTDSIWSSQDYFLSVSKGNLKKVEVTKIVEETDSVVVHGFCNGSEWIKKYDRVLISAGPIGSAGIMVRSGYSEKVTIRDSQTVFLSGFWLGRPSMRKPSMVTLSQAFARIEPHHVSKPVHVQVYGWNPTLPHRIRKEVPITRFVPLPILSALSRFLVNFIVYFDSTDSDTFDVKRDFVDGKLVARIESNDAPNGLKDLQESEIRTLTKELRKSGILTNTSLARWAQVGEGYHSGSSFSYGVGTNDYAIPNSTKGLVHILDASILPSIPSGPLTLNVMAIVRKVLKKIVNDLIKVDVK